VEARTVRDLAQRLGFLLDEPNGRAWWADGPHVRRDDELTDST
jgi:hypothetical protein